MGPDIIYFPVYFEKEYQRNLTYPFILQANGITVKLRPDTTRRQTLILSRSVIDTSHMPPVRWQFLRHLAEPSDAAALQILLP